MSAEAGSRGLRGRGGRGGREVEKTAVIPSPPVVIPSGARNLSAASATPDREISPFGRTDEGVRRPDGAERTRSTRGVELGTRNSELRSPGSLLRSPVVRRFAENKLAVAGLVAILLLYAAAIAAPWIARYDYEAIEAGMRSKPPSAEHWLGTDRNGRDVYARLVKGGQVSLAAGFASVVIIMTVGVTVGACAGFFGGLVDGLMMRFTDVLLSIPLILLLITAASLFQPGITTTIAVIGLASWPGAARLVRGQFLALREQEFVTAARAIGAGPLRIAARHLFPNALAIIIVEATLWLSYAIILEASLSYLGLGVRIPTPSWGNMLQDGQRELIAGAWWLTLFPGLAIFVTVLAFNLMGDGLRDALDPRHRRR